MDWLIENWSWDWPFVFLLLLFVGRAAWIDFRTGRIPNRLLSALMLSISLWLWVLVILVTLFPQFHGLIKPSLTIQHYLLTIALNGTVAFGIGVALWLGGLWAAGDSKLFPLLCLALPLHFYSEYRVELWPGFVLFWNIIMVTLIVILGDLAYRVWRLVRRRLSGEKSAKPPEAHLPWKQRVGEAVRTNARSWGGLLLVFIAIFIFIKTLRTYMSDAIELLVHLDQTILYVILFFLCHPLMKLLSRTWILVLVAALDVVVFALALAGWVEGLTVGSLLAMSAVSIAVIVFRMIYDSYQQRMDFVEVDVEELRPKMVLSDNMRTALKGDAAYFEAQDTELGSLLPDGLKEEQIELVRRWMRERMPGRPAHVQKTFPMAPSIFFGLLITILLQDYVIRLGR